MNEYLDELVAQIESHGTNCVRFFLADFFPNGEDLELSITDVKFEDGEIKVELQ